MPPGGQAGQRGAGRGGSGVMAGADEDAGLSCGPVGPRVQRAEALVASVGVGGGRLHPATRMCTPSSQSTCTCVPRPLVRPASHSNAPSPNHSEVVSPKALLRGADALGSAHTLQHAHRCTHAHAHASPTERGWWGSQLYPVGTLGCCLFWKNRQGKLSRNSIT